MFLARVLLCGIYFLSGASALIFEVLWFHQAGLAFGNSLWASSLVMAGFMAGLACGSALAATYGERWPEPLKVYALLEAVIGVTGVGLIFLLPRLGAALAPFLSPWIDQPWVMNPVRLALAFLVLSIPTTAMGMTLPLMTKVFLSAESRFGVALGNLYGWNTLGAVVGVVVAETLLIGAWGIQGTGLSAAGLNIAAAAGALSLLSWQRGRTERFILPYFPASRAGALNRWHVAAGMSGFCLLALEVIWFRLLSLYFPTTTLAFALMLAIVLAGISAGGLLGSYWLRTRKEGFQESASVAFLSGAVTLACYAAFSWVTGRSAPGARVLPWEIFRIGIPLMFPVSLASGIFFTLSGAALERQSRSEINATGALTLANTLGAALGSLMGGFWMLPVLGTERSILLIGILYGAVGALLVRRKKVSRRSAFRTAAAGLFLVLALIFFPRGTMGRQHLLASARAYGLNESTRVVAAREGLTETIIFLERNWFGGIFGHRLITNSVSMAGNDFTLRRYMKLFVYWPAAVHPDLRRVLLISYGLGSTAKALTDTRGIERIDVVDISRDILEMNSIVYHDSIDQPLRDPRVHVHIEDGRYFLQTTDRRFDLITGEPPPPHAAGVVNLYTREYFELMRRQLNEGGIVTYWLPMHGLSDLSAQAITKGFCDVFTDCSLWSGSGSHLMLVGSRGAQGPAYVDHFSRQWKDPRVRDELKALGLERPEQLGALFIADAPVLQALVRDTPALVDDFPKRILASDPPSTQGKLSREWTDTRRARTDFQRSALIHRLWPESLRIGSLPYFAVQDCVNTYLNNLGGSSDLFMPCLHHLLTRTRLETPVAWFLGGNSDLLRSLDGETKEDLASGAAQYLRAVRAMTRRQYAEAARAFDLAEGFSPLSQAAFRYRIYALCMAGDVELARRLARERLAALTGGNVPPLSELPPFWRWMNNTFALYRFKA